MPDYICPVHGQIPETNVQTTSGLKICAIVLDEETQEVCFQPVEPVQELLEEGEQQES